MTTDSGRSPTGPGAREPSPAVSALRASPPIARFPVAPETVTILGYRPRSSREARWAGLRWNGEEKVLTQSTLMRFVCGADAPYDLHLNVPWCHPDDYVTDEDIDGCKYRVRPRMEAGKRWKGRMVRAVSIERDDTMTPPWAIVVEFAQGMEARRVETSEAQAPSRSDESPVGDRETGADAPNMSEG